MRWITGLKQGLLLGTVLVLGSSPTRGDLSDISIQSVSLEYSGWLREGAPSQLNVGVIMSQTLHFFRTAFLVAVPSSRLNTDLNFTLKVIEARFTNLDNGPATGTPIPVNISIMKADPALGVADPVHSLLDIVNNTGYVSPDIEDDYYYVYNAKLFPGSTTSKSVPPNTPDLTTIPYSISAQALGQDGVIDTIDGVSYIGLMVTQDTPNTYPYSSPGGLKATSLVSLQAVPSVPEPGAFALVSVGLLVAGGWWVRARTRGAGQVL